MTNPYEPPRADLNADAVPPSTDDGDIAPRFRTAMRFALFIQIPLGILTLLVLDMGQAQRAFGVAMLCQWATVYIILMRRARNPTTLDLAIVRFGIVPMFVIAMTVQYLRTMHAISHP